MRLLTDLVIALMRIFPKAIVLTTKSHFHVKRTYASIRGLVVRTITSGKTRVSAIVLRIFFRGMIGLLKFPNNFMLFHY